MAKTTKQCSIASPSTPHSDLTDSKMQLLELAAQAYKSEQKDH